MKFSISLDQRNYLHTNGYILFYEILRKKEIDLLNSGIKEALKLTSCGRDLWRQSPLLKQLVSSRRLADLVYELTQKKPLRLAFDQYLPKRKVLHRQATEEWSCLKYLGEDFAFSVSSLTGLLLLSLDEDNLGQGYFILPSTPLEKLPLSPEQNWFLIGYGDKHSQYLYQLKDPEVHFLKSLGYVFGDKLNEREHPIVLR